MEKRMTAEKLASQIRHQTRRWDWDDEEECEVEIDEPTLTLEESAELIKARDKATLEAAAERVRNDRYIKIKDDEWVSIPDWTLDHVVSAILRDEED